MRVNGLSTGGVTQAKPARANGCGQFHNDSRRARLRAAASSVEIVSSTAELTRASQDRARCSQSLAAAVFLAAAREALLGALDHAALAAGAADQRVDHRPRDRHGLEPAHGLAEIAAALEHLAQQMIGRTEADAPGAQRVRRDVERPQPRGAGAAPERRLVDRSREAPGRQRGESAAVAGPGDAEEFARGPAHARNLDAAAEPGKWPIERAREPRRPALVARRRGAAPLV